MHIQCLIFLLNWLKEFISLRLSAKETRVTIMVAEGFKTIPNESFTFGGKLRLNKHAY